MTGDPVDDTAKRRVKAASNAAYNVGWAAYHNGRRASDCPYDDGAGVFGQTLGDPLIRQGWLQGWADAHAKARDG